MFAETQMDDKENKKTRRKVLRQASSLSAGAIVGSAFLGTATAEEIEVEGEKLDLDFDPTDEKELGDFVVTFDELSHDAKDSIWGQLSDDQQGGVAFGLSPRTMETQPSASQQASLSPNSRTFDELRTSAKSIYGTSPFTLVHSFYWDPSGDSVDDITNNVSAVDIAWGYTWEGEESSNTENLGDSGISYAQGHLKWNGGLNFTCPIPTIDTCTPKIDLYPSSKVQVFPDESFDIISENPDDTIF